FTQCADLFRIFPQMIQTVFAQNCVAVVFLVAILLNLVLPKNMDVTIPSKSES
ncbi:MAG: purine permease, partial [Ruminococcus sp.]|nr:purine permease [Ruminococcus sp.]